MQLSQTGRGLALAPTRGNVFGPNLSSTRHVFRKHLQQRLLATRANAAHEGTIIRSVRSGPDTKNKKPSPNVARGDTKYEKLRRVNNLLDNRQVINTDSLADTLRAHREANKDNILIDKAFSDAGVSNPRKKETELYDAVRLVLTRSDGASAEREREEYEGQIRPLSFDWEIIGNVARSLRLPWMQSLDAAESSRDTAIARLNTEIRAADAYFTPSQKETAAAQLAIDDIAAAVIKTPGIHKRIDVIGSRAAGFATPLSDLDLNLVLEDGIDYEEDVADNALRALFRELRYIRKSKTLSMSYFAASARVPIAVGVHHASAIELQIQCAGSGYGSLETSKSFAAEFPAIKPLFRIVKQLLKIRDLAGGAGSHGGITSYPLLNMLAVSLKLNSKVDAYDLGQHLLRFLELYGNLDFYANGITQAPSAHFSMEPGSLFDKETAAEAIDRVTQDPVGAVPTYFNPRTPQPLIWEKTKDDFMMVLHDPANPYNDLGRSAWMIKHIQATFRDLHARLKSAMSDWDRRVRAQGEVATGGPSLLAPLIEGDYTMYKLERRRLSETADKIKQPQSDT